MFFPRVKRARKHEAEKQAETFETAEKPKGEHTMLNITKNIENGAALFALEGRLDTVTAPELEQELNESLEGISDLTMDFEKLDYISSAGLRLLLSAQKRMSAQGQMKLISVNPTIMEIFEITGFSEILTIE